MAVSSQTFILTVFNVMNVILGSGVLGMGYAMNSLGWLTFTLLLVAFYLLGIFVIQNLVYCCEIANIDSYEDMGFKTFGKPGKLYVVFCIFMQTFSAMVSFMYIVKSELPEVLATASQNLGNCPETQPWYVSGTTLYLLILLLIVLPLASLKQIDFLSWTSTMAMIAMMIFTVIISCYSFIITCPAVENEGGSHGNSSMNCKGFSEFTHENTGSDWEAFTKGVEAQRAQNFLAQKGCPINAGPDFSSSSGSIKAILAVPIMVFAFMCQESIVPVYAQLMKDNGTGADMMRIAKTALSGILVLYWFIAFMAYRTWGSATISDMLLPYSYGYRSSWWILIARCCSIICVIFSTPLLHYPCRRCLQMLFFGNYDFTWARHIGIMVILLSAVAITVGTAKSLKQIFTYGGIISSGSLMIILPNLCYNFLTSPEQVEKFDLEKKNNDNQVQEQGETFIQNDTTNEAINEKRRNFSRILGYVGIGFMILCFILQLGQDLKMIQV